MHWLEGAEHPFLVWTDHKNLEYLRTAKSLNSKQARWALLFTRFNFTVSYCPGSNNVEPDTLSRLYSPATTPSDSETILPTSCLAAAIIWGIESLVRKAQCFQLDPTGCLSWTLPVLLEWAHSSRLTCHPDSRLSLASI